MWISPRLSPCIGSWPPAVEAGAIYTCISFALGRRHVPVATDGSLSSTSWLLWEANHFKSGEKEQRKKWETACAFIMQHPHMLNKQNNNLGALPGHLARSVQAVEEPMGISPGWNTTGTSPGWEPHPEQCWWIQHCLLSWPAALEQWPNTCKRDKGTVWRLWSYLCPEGFLHLGSSFSFKGTASFSKSMERHGVFWLGWSDWIHFTSSRDLPFGYLKK